MNHIEKRIESYVNKVSRNLNDGWEDCIKIETINKSYGKYWAHVKYEPDGQIAIFGNDVPEILNEIKLEILESFDLL